MVSPHVISAVTLNCNPSRIKRTLPASHTWRKSDNIKVDNVHIDTRPTGNDRQRALRKLRKDSPTLHAEVLAGKLSMKAALFALRLNELLCRW